METHVLNEVLACVAEDRTVFRYARDDYAVMLLSYISGKGKRICDIKRSPFRGLLEKPAIKPLIAGCGQGTLTQNDCRYGYSSQRQNFVLTVGTWDRNRRYFSQTTTDSGNLVLHLNFNTGHDCQFYDLVGKNEICFFKYHDHPILQRGERAYFRHTLAWARIDLDFDTGEVLIEEIQTDWLRRAQRYLTTRARYIANNPEYQKRMGIHSTMESIEHYVKLTLKPFYGIWDEALLAAVIQFCVEELGIRRIYYHTYDTGRQLKRIGWGQPPRSLYTDLPKKFCFSLTDQAPDFLKKSKVAKRKLKKVRSPFWYELVM